MEAETPVDKPLLDERKLAFQKVVERITLGPSPSKKQDTEKTSKDEGGEVAPQKHDTEKAAHDEAGEVTEDELMKCTVFQDSTSNAREVNKH
eukprot:6492753-Amphidinium_carterae.1